MGLQEAYHEKYVAELRELDAEIQKIEAKAMRAQASAKILFYEELQRIYEKRERAASRLDALKDASGAIWDGLKAGVEAAWNEFRTGVRHAAARFNDH